MLRKLPVALRWVLCLGLLFLTAAVPSRARVRVFVVEPRLRVLVTLASALVAAVCAVVLHAVSHNTDLHELECDAENVAHKA